MLYSLLFLLLLQQDMDLPVVKPALQPASTAPIAAPTSVPRGGLVSTPLPTPAPPRSTPERDPRDEPPPVLFGEEIESSSDSIYFVLDISGSMAQSVRPVTTALDAQGHTLFQQADGSWSERSEVPTRMELAKSELAKAVSALPPNFRFNVLVYDCSIRTWHPRMVAADPGAKAAALLWVRSLQPGGQTSTGPATAFALTTEPANLCVVLVTDGAPNCPYADMNAHRSLIRVSNLQGATINVFGICAAGEYRGFARAVASDNGPGSYVDVD